MKNDAIGWFLADLGNFLLVGKRKELVDLRRLQPVMQQGATNPKSSD